MRRFKNIDFWLGLIILAVLGFLFFTLVSGIGYLIALVFLLHSWWYIVRYGCCVFNTAWFA